MFSMNSFHMFPVTRGFGCRGIHSVGTAMKTCKYTHGRNFISGGYDSLRSIDLDSTRSYNEGDKRDSFYESVSAYLFRQDKTWKRLSHLLDLATDGEDDVDGEDHSSHKTKKSVADVGTDHGLLAMGLALTESYEKVVGVDISDQALKRGAFVLLEKIRKQTATLNDESFDLSRELPVEFRVGNGLEALEFGEADTICIAGMGVNTMLRILEQDSSTGTGENLLQRIGCKRLVLQATNSRPRNLILLYDRLKKMGWKVNDERIEKLSSRWYITTRFEPSIDSASGFDPGNDSVNSSVPDLPGLKLRCFHESSSTRKTFDEYCFHHRRWIKQDADASSERIDPRDLRWLEYFDGKF